MGFEGRRIQNSGGILKFQIDIGPLALLKLHEFKTPEYPVHRSELENIIQQC